MTFLFGLITGMLLSLALLIVVIAVIAGLSGDEDA